MGISDIVKRILGGKAEPPLLEAVGSISDRPTLAADGDSGGKVLSFHLESRPGLEFRQAVSALAAEHKRGDKVKVSYRLDSGGAAVVELIQKL